MKRDNVTKILTFCIILLWRVIRVWRRYVIRRMSSHDDSKHHGLNSAETKENVSEDCQNDK